MKLVTRAQWGARDYRRPNGAITYSSTKRRGVKLHYLGTAYSDRAHTQCAAYVRHIQAVHMDGNGWSDIGYSFVVCTHGYVYEGRGLTRRNSANGNTSLNEQDYAVLLLVGSTGHTKPTDAQLHGARDAIEYCRAKGPAGTWIGGHRDGYATDCPGDAVYAWAKAGAPRPTSEKEDDMPLTAEDKTWIENAITRLAPPAVWNHTLANPHRLDDDGNPRQVTTRALLLSEDGHFDTVIRALGDLDTTGLSEAQVQAIADKVAAHPALTDSIAAKVAEHIAERLAE